MIMDLRETAKSYINAGINSLPAIVKPDEKRPLVQWTPYQYKMVRLDEVDSLFRNHYGICVVCGEISGGLEIIDFDMQGKCYEQWANQIKTVNPPLFESLVIERSQSGGLHVAYRCIGLGTRNETLAVIIETVPDDSPVARYGKTFKPKTVAGQWVIAMTGIETRCNGGICVIAPTPKYSVIQGDWTNLPTISRTERDFLIETARSFNQATLTNTAPTAPTNNLPRPHVEKRYCTEKKPWEDYHERGRENFKKLLEKHGWQFARNDKEGNERWMRPGSTRESATLFLESPVFYIHSTNCTLPANSYSLFYVFAHMEHGDDLKAATKELARLGYGEPLRTEPVELNNFLTGSPAPLQEDEPEESEHFYDDDLDDCPETFPEHLLAVPGFIGELSQFINETSYARQPVYSLAAAIAFQSLLCAHNIKDPTGIRTNPYILAVGRTSCGKNRGRVVIREIMKRLKDMPAISDWYDPTHYVANRIASAEAIGTWLSKNNGILMWLWDEVGRALDTPEHKRPANINAMITAMMILYTSAADEYDPNLRADVKNTKPAIEQPNFILYGTSTKEKMFEGFSVGNLEDGLLGRLLIFEGNDDWEDVEQEDVQPVTESIVEQAHWWFCQRANRINPATPDPKTVGVTNEAKAIFRQLQNVKTQVRKENNKIKDALWGRVVEQARQFALAYAASASHENPVVNEDAAKWACDVVVYLTKRKYNLAKKHVAGSEFDKNQKEVLRFIEEQQDGKCPCWLISAKFRKFKRWERTEILDNLLETNAIKKEEEKQEGKRKKQPVYVINRKSASTKKRK
jgi:hypothetical protein